MPDMEKVIKGLEELYGFLFREYANIPAEESKIYYERTCAIRDAIAMLKEQEKPNGKCVNECECWDAAYERGKQDALKEQEAVVRCKDCKHGNLWSEENVIVCDKFSKTRDKNWFCADGVKKDA